MKMNRITKTTPIILAAMLTFTGCGEINNVNTIFSTDKSAAISADQADNSANYYQEAECESSYAGADNSAVRFNVKGGVTADSIQTEAEEMNTEEYSAITENGFISAADEPLSTFSADVDTASYSNLRRMLQSGVTVPADAVRIEEMINYFHYDYPEPQPKEPFSVTTEYADCPWNPDTKLLRIGMKAKDIDMRQRKPMNLVFLIDVSGSMYTSDKLPLVQKAFGMLTEELNENDCVSIVTYAGADFVVLEGAAGNDVMTIRSAIDQLEAGGGTAGAAGINTAYQIAQDHFIQNGNNRIILATDGDLNVGPSSESELKELIENQRDKGIFLSVLGFGTGNIKDNKMETLADNGNGNYAYIDSENEAKRVLVEEMGGTLVTVAKDVKYQVEFDPAFVNEYRLIGYENRTLAAEDFDDDTKDAGEIGAGHTVTALYEIALADDAANGGIGTVSVRYKEPDEDESKLLTYPVTEAAYASEMSDDLRFASAVASFGMLLRDSSFKGNSTKELVLSLAETESAASDPYKAEFAELVKCADIQ